MRKVTGFTIIELVVVITILGILAAVALPRFFDVQNEARGAAASGAAGAVASGAALNYGTFLARGSSVQAGAGGATVLNTCTTAVLGRAITGGIPDNVTVSDGPTALTSTLSDGAVGDCIFTNSLGGAATTVSIVKVD